MVFDYSSLSENAQRLLGIYAYALSGSYVNADSAAKLLISAFPDYSHEQSVEELVQAGLIEYKGYIWHSNSSTYSIRWNHFAPSLMYLLGERRDLVLEYKQMNISKNANFKALRHTIAELVDSGYRSCNTAANITIKEVTFLNAIGLDPKAKPIFIQLARDTFSWFIENQLHSLCETDTAADFQYFHELIDGNIFILPHTRTYLHSLVDLHNYLFNGIPPQKEPTQNDAASLVLAAIRCMGAGRYADAVKLFSLALKLTNRHSQTKNMYLHCIVNYYLILAYAHEGSTDSINKLRIFSNKKELESYTCLEPSSIVANCVLNTNIRESKKSVDSNLTKARENEDLAGYHALYYLIANYLGYKTMVTYPFPNRKPNMAILQNELSEYIELSGEEKEELRKKFGTPALTSIRRMQEWELVVNNIERILNSNGSIIEETSNRLMYVIPSIDCTEVEVREQNRLRSGEWGSGKTIALTRYKTGMIEFLNDADRRILDRHISSHTYALQLEDVIEEMVPESRLYIGRYAPFELVTVTEEKPYLIIQKESDGFHISSNVRNVNTTQTVFINKIGHNHLSFTRFNKEQLALFSNLISLGTFPLEAEDTLRTLLPKLGVKVEIHSDLIDGGSTLRTINGQGQASLMIRPNRDGYYNIFIGVHPVPGSRSFLTLGKGKEMYIDEENGERVWVKRDFEQENRNRAIIKSFLDDMFAGSKDFPADYSKYLLDPDEEVNVMEPQHLLEFIDFIQKNPDVISAEWPEGQKLNIKHTSKGSAVWEAKINDRGTWFEIEGDIAIDEKTVISMSELLDLINKSKGRFIQLKNGEYIALSDKLRRQLNALNSIATRERGNIRISPFSAALLSDENIYGDITLILDSKVSEQRQRIIDSSSYSPAIPKELNATLRPYQIDGYQWIARLNSWGAGALLADDMGLGKTVQSIAFFLLKACEGPTLVVAPASVAPNWLTELEKFAPSLNCRFLNAELNRKEVIEDAKAGDVVITTYGLLLSVADDITKKEWITACLDEAHIIKNRGAKTSGVAMKLQARNRIMLTGTPLQNHLGELWNLFQFVNPGLLGGYEDFQRRFIIPIERDEDRYKQEMLDNLVHPFMLRRTKNAVLKELPEKTEIYQKVELSAEELAIYEVIRHKAERMLEERGDSAPDINVLAEITRLRQAACSATLVERNWQGASSKVTALMELLDDVIEGGHRALVFSQFTSFLDIIQKQFKEAGINYLYIDGSTPVAQRAKLVQQFQEGKCPIFVISLKAGGLGLNLTGANYVFHLDPWWNPAIEQQATDRAYRIGQKQAVTVYHLIAQNTIEEKIIRLHEKKRTLAENILAGTDLSHKLTGKDLLEMVSK